MGHDYRPPHATHIVLEEKQIPKSNLRRDTRGSGELQTL